jgi:hypothetical protein
MVLEHAGGQNVSVTVETNEEAAQSNLAVDVPLEVAWKVSGR